jgi:hypothetical protein
MKKITKEEVVLTVKRWIDENPDDRSVILMMAEKREEGKPVCTHATFTDNEASAWMFGDLFYADAMLQYIAASVAVGMVEADERRRQK